MMATLYKKVKDDTTTEILRKEWLAYLPLMTTGIVQKMTFEEYKGRCVTSIDTRPASEILAEVAQIEKELKGG